MTLEIKLDTNALSSLIDSDPEFKTKIQQGVLANISNRYLKESSTLMGEEIARQAKIARDQVLSEYGSFKSSGYQRVFELNSTLSEQIKTRVTDLVKTTASLEIGKMIDEQILERINELEDRISAKVAVAVSRKVDTEISKAVNDKVQEAITKIVTDAVTSKFATLLK